MDNTIVVNYIAILISVIIFIISFYKYCYASYLFVVILPLIYNLQDIEGFEAFSTYRILISLLFFVAAFKFLPHWNNFPFKKFLYSYLVLVIGLIISASFSPSPGEAFTRSLTYVFPLMTFIITYMAVIDNEDGFKYIFKGIIIGFGIVAIYGIIELLYQENILANLDIIRQDTNWIEDIRLGEGRLISFIGQPVYLALYIVYAIIGVLFYNKYIISNRIQKLIIFAIILCSVICLIFTGTRTSYLVILIMLISLIFIMKEVKSKIRLLKYTGIFIIMIIIIVPQTVTYLVDSFNVEKHESENYVGRLEVTAAMLDIFKDHIITGFGPGYIYKFQQDYGDLGIGGMENQYAYLLVDSGLVGFLPFIGFMVITIASVKKLFSSHRFMVAEWSRLVFAILVAMSITSITYGFLTVIIAHILMIYLGILFGLSKINCEIILGS